ncbi:MAG: SAM-dependent methyltransferase, partial [Rubrivivax sp.]|nr:SAM-dependent methyltransferase [Rubrivivax sp.]
TIPGVSSFAAAAAATGTTLAEEDETLAVIPAAYGVTVIDHLLDEFDTLVLMKVKPLMDEVIELLERRGLLATSCFVEKVGAPDARVVRDIASLKGVPVNYLSLLLVGVTAATGVIVNNIVESVEQKVTVQVFIKDGAASADVTSLQNGLAADALVIAACWNITYLFRLGFERWISARPGYDVWVMLGVIAAYLLAFSLLRVPQSMWRFSGFGEVKRLTLACAAAGTVAAVVVMGLGLSKVPRAVLALHPVVALMGVALVRIAYRMLYEHARSRITGGEREIRRAIVMGAGAAARLLLAGIHEQGWTVLGLLDDDPAKRRARIGGAPVLGPLEAITDQAVRGAATHIVIALPSASPAQRRRALELAGSTGLPVLTVPPVDELRTGKSRVERLRDIEPDDLLGREPVQLDEAGIGAVLSGKVVLITGAGGSIGSELCR